MKKIILFLLTFLLASTSYAALAGYAYRKQIDLTGQAGASTDYQVKLLVGETSGATGEDFDIEGNAYSFPSAANISGDLRFTDNDEDTELKFYVESVTGTTPNRLATVWVKVTDDLSSGTVSIYCYYTGNADNVSNGTDTFILFDDFSGDLSKWSVTTAGSSTLEIVAGEAVATQDATNGVSASAALGVTSNFELYLRSNSIANKWCLYGGIWTQASGDLALVDRQDSGSSGKMIVVDSGDTTRYWKTSTDEWTTTFSDTSWESSANTWYRSRIRFDGTNVTWIVSDDSDSQLDTTTWSESDLTAFTSLKVAWGKPGGGAAWSGAANYDDIRVRKYVATEPSFNTAGAQQQLGVVKKGSIVSSGSSSVTATGGVSITAP